MDEHQAAVAALREALLRWRDAKPNTAAERRAARMLAYSAARLLRIDDPDI